MTVVSRHHDRVQGEIDKLPSMRLFALVVDHEDVAAIGAPG